MINGCTEKPSTKCSLGQWFLNVNVLANHQGIRALLGKASSTKVTFGGSQPRTLRAHPQHEGWELDTNKVSPPDHRAGCMAERRVAEGSEDWKAC